jgi:hypothetical protein
MIRGNIFFIIFPLFLYVAEIVSAHKFFFYLPPMSMKCMGEYLGDNTVGSKDLNYLNYLN